MQAYFNYCNALAVGYALVFISINVRAYHWPIPPKKACTLLVDYENDDMKQNFYSKNQNLSQKKLIKISLGKEGLFSAQSAI